MVVLLPLDAVLGLDADRLAAVVAEVRCRRQARRGGARRLRGRLRRRARQRGASDAKQEREPAPRLTLLRLRSRGRITSVAWPLKMIVSPRSSMRKPSAVTLPNGPWPVTGSSPSAVPRRHVDMRAVGVELVALVLEQRDIAEEIEELRLRLIEAGIGAQLEPVAARRWSDRAFGPLERDEVRRAWASGAPTSAVTMKGRLSRSMPV